MLARGSHQNRLRAARLAETFPAKHPPPRRGHSIYGGSGRTGLADNDHNRRPAQPRRRAPRPARDRYQKSLMLQLAIGIVIEEFNLARKSLDSASPMLPRDSRVLGFCDVPYHRRSRRK